jgi:Zn-dependent peptidase ImmA (M78 family)/transcriptional regulator with XRE-family HTH domain
MISQRIRQARAIAGLSQDEVVQALGGRGVSLTKAALSKYERGASVPRASLLKQLGEVLNVPAEYFLREPQVSITWLAFRKRAAAGAREQDRVKAVASERVEAYVRLRESLTLSPGKPFPNCLPFANLDDAEGAAGRLRKAWDLDDLPIESLTDLIEDREGVVVEVEGSEDAVDGLAGLANGAHAVVVVDPSVEDNRKRFTLAHELGHLVMDKDAVTDPDEEERMANRFASAFLVPKAVAVRELGEKRTRLSFEELKLLKVKHGLSMQAWIYRARDCGIIEDQHFRFLFDQMSRMGIRRREPVEYRGRERPQRFKQMVLRALAEGLVSQKQAVEFCPQLGFTMERGGEERAKASELRALPVDQRDTLLERAAASLAERYAADSELTAFDAFDEGSEGAHA